MFPPGGVGEAGEVGDDAGGKVADLDTRVVEHFAKRTGEAVSACRLGLYRARER